MFFPVGRLAPDDVLCGVLLHQ